MRQKKLLVLLMSLISFCSFSKADPKDSTSQNTILEREGKETIKCRPKSPDRQIVICEYDGQSLNL